MSILPNIIEVAQSFQVELDARTIGKRETLAKCPFCDNGYGKRTKRYYLSLNEDKNLFQCWYCKERGGVIYFMSLLSGRSEQTILDELRNRHSTSSYQKHPAEKLTTSQLKRIGYGRINWCANREFDYETYRLYRERVWDDWLIYLKDQVNEAYKTLYLHVLTGQMHKGIAAIQKQEQLIGASLLPAALQLLGSEDEALNMDRFESERFLCEVCKREHPFYTLPDLPNTI